MQRKANELEGILVLFALIAAIFYEPTRPFSLSLLAVLLVIFAFAWRSGSKDAERHQAALSRAKQKISDDVANHLETLANRRDTLVRVDRYGVVDGSDWNKEVQHFVDRVVRPGLLDDEAAAVAKAGLSVVSQELIEGPVAEYCDQRSTPIHIPADISATDFEGLCASVFRKNGWTASTTKGSGDQGADVVAEHSGTIVVLQCKLYSGTVGNKAVQEALAARHFYSAHHAAVVCKSDYSKSARTLAQAAGIEIMSFAELEGYARRLIPH